jgi:ABC-type polysaccharide/polyol phosphate export permease
MNLQYELSKLWARRDMVRNLVVRDLKIKYKGSFLGFLWSFLNPVIMIILYYLVFGKVVGEIRRDITDEGVNFGFFLATAMWPWMMFSSAVGKSAPLFILNDALIKKVYFPREILPIATVISEFINFLYGLSVLVIVLAVTGSIFNWYFLLLPLFLFILLMFTMGLSLLVSVWDVYFRDTEQILNSLLTIGFFATPIFYTVERVRTIIFPTYAELSQTKILLNQTLSFIYFLNPFATLLPYIRRCFLNWGVPITVQGVLVLLLASIAFLAISYIYFKRHEYRLVEEV